MQAVPTSIEEGPDDQYYVGQLTGFPFPVGGANVYRVNPRTGRQSVFASGFTNIMDLAFGRDGTLYVLEIDHDGLLGPGDGGRDLRHRPQGARGSSQLPAGTLPDPGGITVGKDGLYVSTNATLARRRAGPAHPLTRTLDHPQGGLTPLRVRRGRRMKRWCAASCPGMTLRTASALAALAATLLVAGCGGSDNDTEQRRVGAAPTTTARRRRQTPEAATSEDAATIKAASGALGAMLVDAEGRSLYLWEADQDGTSACDGPCADAWPPVTTIGEPKAGDGVDAKLLGTSKRADGTLGVTYNGHPLYYFQGDAEAGQANGQGSDGFGAPWWVVSPRAPRSRSSG